MELLNDEEDYIKRGKSNELYITDCIYEMGIIQSTCGMSGSSLFSMSVIERDNKVFTEAFIY